MTTYSVWNQTLVSGTASTNPGAARTDGMQFTVSSTCQLTGFWWYVPAGETTLTGSTFTGELWTTTTGTSGTLVTSQAGTGTWTAGAWNFISLPTPVTLNTGTTYVAGIARGVAVGLQFVHNYFSSGGTGQGTTISGPINVPGTATALNNAQMPTAAAGAGTFPATSTGTWVGVDISVSSPGDYSLWEQAAGTGGSSDSNTPGYTLGQAFTLSSACTMNHVWFYSNASAISLPGIVAVWTSGGTLLNSNSSPTWSGVAGSGWVSTPLSTSLASGNYVVGVVGKNDGNLWYSITTTGEPAVTNGPISCAANSCVFDGTGDGVLRFPTTGFGSNNIWVDADVVPSGGTTNITVSDFAGQVEAFTIIATVSISDAAGTVETKSESVTLTEADMAGAVDVVSTAASLLLSDVAGAAESFVIGRTIAFSDSAGVTETIVVSVSATLSDVGAQLDALFKPGANAPNPLKPAIVLVASAYAPTS